MPSFRQARRQAGLRPAGELERHLRDRREFRGNRLQQQADRRSLLHRRRRKLWTDRFGRNPVGARRRRSRHAHGDHGRRQPGAVFYLRHPDRQYRGHRAAGTRCGLQGLLATPGGHARKLQYVGPCQCHRYRRCRRRRHHQLLRRQLDAANHGPGRHRTDERHQGRCARGGRRRQRRAQPRHDRLPGRRSLGDNSWCVHPGRGNFGRGDADQRATVDRREICRQGGQFHAAAA